MSNQSSNVAHAAVVFEWPAIPHTSKRRTLRVSEKDVASVAAARCVP
jgi:hypothetical protein